MVKLLSSQLLSTFIIIFFSSTAGSITRSMQPHPFISFKAKNNQIGRSCSYKVVIKTSCSSTSFTRDKISLAFGDFYGNEVYAPRLDDPYSRTFEKCSTDTFQINGQCTDEICYLYMLRKGSDGWKPETVKIYGPNRRAATFYYNTFLPNGIWFGFNLCHGRSVSAVM